MMTTTAIGDGNGDEPSQPRIWRGSFRVLVVDDNDVDRELTTRHLSAAWPFEHDLVVDQACDAQEALDKLLRHRWTLLLLDWNMPGQDGEDVLREMRRVGITVPVVVISGCETDEIIPTIVPYGAGYLHKDEIDAVSLHQAVALALRWPIPNQD